jgi:hypothetical protein
LQRFATWFARECDNLNRLAAKAAQGRLNNMTKVILAGTDEGGGCEQTHPEDAAAKRISIKAPHDGQAQGIREGVDSHGSRCFE